MPLIDESVYIKAGPSRLGYDVVGFEGCGGGELLLLYKQSS